MPGEYSPFTRGILAGILPANFLTIIFDIELSITTLTVLDESYRVLI